MSQEKLICSQCGTQEEENLHTDDDGIFCHVCEDYTGVDANKVLCPSCQTQDISVSDDGSFFCHTCEDEFNPEKEDKEDETN